jgi:hypothetical protein
MPSYDPDLFNVDPYYDDFSEERKFLRMLFRPGYAVQARELTQLQTILQNQIERFGNNIFKDGSNIIGGEISTQTLSYVRINPNTTTTPIAEVTQSDLYGHRLIQRDGDGNIISKAIVVRYLPRYSDADPYGVAIISYMTGTEFTPDAVLECDNPDKLFSVRVPPANPNTPATGRVRIVAISEGIYYVNGHFVRTNEQIQPAYVVTNNIRVFANPTGIMGFEVLSNIVTERDDYTLKDPANGSYNYNAPGSHRFKIDLELKFLASIADENFIELVVYENGEVIKKFDDTQYSDLVKLFAQRTYDESGNYVVKPFDISFRDGDSTKVFADVGSGKAYVFGYEYESKFKDIVEIPRARTAGNYTDARVDNYYGNYAVGKYYPESGDRLNSLFSSIQSGERSLAYQIYGATAQVPSTEYLDKALFEAFLLKVEPIGATAYSTEGGTMEFKAYLSNITQINATGDINQPLNLYLYSYATGLSTKIMSDVTLFRSTQPTSQSRLPKLYDAEDQNLLVRLNGNTPTTMVKDVNAISFVGEVSRGFVVDNANRFPFVSHGQGSNYAWCFENGFVPSGNDVVIDETDGYYLVYESGTALRRGTILRIVGENITVPTGQTKVTGKITGDGDFVQITSALPLGSYYLVGKTKADSINIPQNPVGKVRQKTKATYSEVITNTINTLNVFKRNIRRNSVGDVVWMYFVLDKADAIKIESITDGAGNDISDEFLFDTGQRDAVYLLGRIYVKPDYYTKYAENTTFQINVTYSYYEHSGYGPITRESYAGVSYDDIQVFVSPRTGDSVNLANAADYRYLAKIAGYVSSGATSDAVGSTTPSNLFNRPVIRYSNGLIPDKSTVASTHVAYLPRIDKLVVSKNIAADDAADLTTLQRLGGVPSDSPVIPEDITDSMTLFVLSVPAYTFNGSDIKAQSIGNTRYTMKDIGDLSSRMNAIEQTVELSDIEQSVISRDLRTSAGADAVKRAILVDTFNGHSVGDVSDEDYRCSIDVERGLLRPSFESNAYSFRYAGFDPGITLTTDNILCGDYTGTSFIYQDKASGTINLNSFCLPNWVGNIVLTPFADYWYDTVTRPIVQFNDDGSNEAWQISNMNNNNGHGSQWNDWESLWNGISVELSEAESKKNSDFFARVREKEIDPVVDRRWNAKTKVRRFTIPLDKLRDRFSPAIRKKDYYVDIGYSTLINKSVCPYMRGVTLTFDAHNMKPGTQVHVFMDNVNMNQYCTVNGATGPFTTSLADGSVTGITMSVPDGTFVVGDKIIRLIDDANNNIENATTIAEATFYTTGTNYENPFGISSIRPVDVRRKTPNSNKVVSNPLYRKKSINTTKYNQWIDPLAQTFEVSENDNPNGVFLASVDLYFSTRDKELPVTVEICPVVNGIPNPSVILPFSTVTLSPSGVNASENTPRATNFKFSTPVFLSPGSYAILVRTNSLRYNVYVANIGKNDIVTEKRISSTFSGGMLFKAQNASEPVGDANTDLMFRINRCKFDAPGGSIILSHVNQSEDFVADLVQPNVFAFIPQNLTLSTSILVGPKEYNATVNRNLRLDSPFTVNESADFEMIFNLGGNNTDTGTFMIDLDRTNAVVVKNLINASENSTNVEEAIFSGRDDDTARYISKKVLIPNGQTAKEIKVILDANIPKDTFIRVYAKTYNSEQITSDLVGYKRMAIEPTSEFFVGGVFTNSLNDNDFREATYSVVPSGTDWFNVFAIKVCMYTLNSAKVPVVKNLRVVAIE